MNEGHGVIWTGKAECHPILTQGDRHAERVGSWAEEVDCHSPFKSVAKTITSAVTENNSRYTKSLPELDFLNHDPSTLSMLPTIEATHDGCDSTNSARANNVPELDFRNVDESHSSDCSSDTGRSKRAESEDFKSADEGDEHQRRQIEDEPVLPTPEVQSNGLRKSDLELTPRAMSKESMALAWLKKRKRSASLGTRSLKSIASTKSAEQQWTAYAMPNFG